MGPELQEVSLGLGTPGEASDWSQGVEAHYPCMCLATVETETEAKEAASSAALRYGQREKNRFAST